MTHEVQHVALLVEERPAQRGQGWGLRLDDLDRLALARGFHRLLEVPQLAG